MVKIRDKVIGDENYQRTITGGYIELHHLAAFASDYTGGKNWQRDIENVKTQIGLIYKKLNHAIDIRVLVTKEKQYNIPPDFYGIKSKPFYHSVLVQDAIHWLKKEGIIVSERLKEYVITITPAEEIIEVVSGSDENSDKQEKGKERWKSAYQAVQELINGKPEMTQEAAIKKNFDDKHKSVENINTLKSYKSSYIKAMKKYEF